jgi:hypothetical protein
MTLNRTPKPEIERGYTWSEEWRRICEAREVLSWSLERRRKYLREVELTRGSHAANELKKIIIQEFERLRHERF